MSQQFKWEVTIKYTRHPFREDGTQDKSIIESTSWFTTIYDNNDRLTEGRAKDAGRQKFIDEKHSYIQINSVRVSKKTAY